MNNYVRPTVFISACIEFESCRYDGEMIRNDYIARLLPFVDVVRTCPELAIGLGAPREAIRLVHRKGEEEKLLSSQKGNDYTKQMNDFTDAYTNKLLNKDIDGFILKAKSPTCGLSNVKVYYDIGKANVKTGKSSGMFGRMIIEKFPKHPKETDRRLSNFNLRDRFFTEIFTLADYRLIKQAPTMKKLVAFHSKNKYLFMSYHTPLLKKMGQIVANHNKLPVEEVYEIYNEELLQLFNSEPTKKKRINVLEHIYGYFKRDVAKSEKDYYFEVLENYRNGQVPYSNVLIILKGWAIRFEEKYLMDQTIFNPYPSELVMVTDSGKNV